MKAKTQKTTQRCQKVHRGVSLRVVLHSAMDFITDWSERIGLVYILCACTLIAGVVGVAYCTISEDIRNVFTPLIGGVFSLVIIPLVMERYKQAAEQKKKNYEQNAAIYREYIKFAIGVCGEREVDEASCKDYRDQLGKWVRTHYLDICMSFPSRIYWSIHLTDLYLSRNKMDLAQYYAAKSMIQIRKHAGMTGTACNSQRLMKHYLQNGGDQNNDTRSKKTN